VPAFLRTAGSVTSINDMPASDMPAPIITLVGAPTALIEAGGFRLLTDPTVDASGGPRLILLAGGVPTAIDPR
jgi:L-ascorbate metabolism protein UlaG (beta-lactamase superfamily)